MVFVVSGDENAGIKNSSMLGITWRIVIYLIETCEPMSRSCALCKTKLETLTSKLISCNFFSF